MISTDDIIPISYVGGTGGNFLYHFITNAKKNITGIMKLSEHGNTHLAGTRETSEGLPVGMDWPDEVKINYLLTNTYVTDPDAIKPYYIPVHIVDINAINLIFKKSIRIVYDLDDIEDLTIVFYGKWAIDTKSKHQHKSLREIHHWFYIKMKTWLPKFNNIENMPNVLFISWKELFREDIDILIEKINKFTAIPVENFSKEAIIHWRNKTQYCIDKFKDVE